MENQKNHYRLRAASLKAHKLENNPQFSEFVPYTEEEEKAAVIATEEWKKQEYA